MLQLFGYVGTKIMTLRKYIVLVIAIFFANTSFSQLIADFKALEGYQKTDGSGIIVCNPDEIDFTTTSTFNGNPIDPADPDYAYEWFFDPIPTPITKATPAVAYTVIGVYSVRLKITNKNTGESSSVTKANFVEVVSKPVVDFELEDNKGCVPLTVKLINKTVLSGNISADYSWVASGAGSSTDENPTMVITAPGIYNVSLEVVDEYGCRNSLSKTKVIEAKKQPVATFQTNKTFACDPPLEFTLTANETGAFRYTWNIDGIGTAKGNPYSDSLLNPGTYNVTLTVDSGLGCFATLTKTNYLRISNLDVDLILPSDTLCVGTNAQFKSVGTGAETYYWTFGDGTVSNVQDQIKKYDAVGEYDVCIKVTGDGGACDKRVCKKVYVENVDAKIVVDKLVSCLVPETINFDASTSDYPPGSTFKWTVQGNTYNSITGSHTFTSFGTFNLKLEVTSPSGCKDVSSVNIRILPLSLNFTVDKFQGCVPLTTVFTDISNYGGNPVNSRVWEVFDLDNPTVPIYSSSNPSSLSDGYTFNTDGKFKVQMTIENAQGCKGNIDALVIAGLKPTADFEVHPRDTCAEAETIFADSSYVLKDGVKNRQVLNFWRWFHEEGPNSEQNPKIKYFRTGHDTLNGVPENTSPGTRNKYDLRLVVGYNGCYDTLLKPNYFEKWGPISGGLTKVQPCGSDTLYVIGSMFAWTKRTWIVDSQFPNVNDTTIVEDFPSYQDTTVNGQYVGNLTHSQWFASSDTLKLYAPGGFSGSIVMVLENNAYPTATNCELSRSITIGDATPTEFNLPDRMCYTTTPGFADSVEIRGTSIIGPHRWLVKDTAGVISELGKNINNFYFTPPTPGTYEITLEYARSSPCIKTITRTITFEVPEVEIILEDGAFSGCSNLLVNLLGNEKAGTVIDTWVWKVFNIYDPLIPVLLQTYTGKNPPAHEFSGSGEYLFHLEATDDIGCVTQSSFGEKVILVDPIAKFTLGKSGYCDKDSLLIVNKSEYFKPLDYKWYFNDVLVSSDSVPKIELTAVDSIDLTLIVSNDVCADTLTVIDAISVDPYPVFEISAENPYANCPPLTTKLYPTFSSDPIDRYFFTWDLGVGESYVDSTIAFYELPGDYDISLKVETPNGCADSVFKADFIHLEGPQIDSISISDRAVCANDSITLIVHGGLNTVEYRWNFGEGNNISIFAPDSVVRYAYNRGYTDSVTINLFLINGTCQVTYPVKILVDELTALIEPLAEDTLCDYPATITYHNISQGNVFDPTWEFDGNGFQLDSTITYTGPGRYQTVLRVSDAATGCSDTDTSFIWIFDRPDLGISPDQILCAGDSALIEVSGADIYQWSPTVGLSNPLNVADSSKLYANPTNSTVYTVIGTDAATKCTNTKIVQITRDKTQVGFSLNYNDSCGNTLVNIDYPSNPPIVGSNIDWQIKPKLATADAFSSLINNYNISDPDTVFFTLTIWDKDPKCSLTAKDTAVVYPLPEVTLIPDTVICFGESIVLTGTGGDTIRWDVTPALEPVPEGYNPTVNPQNNVSYIMTVVDTFAYCEKSATAAVFVDKALAKVEIDRLDTCGFGKVSFSDLGSVGNLFTMDWGDGNVDTVQNSLTNPKFYDQPGVYEQIFIARDNPLGKTHCQDTLRWTYEVYPLPTTTATAPKQLICNYDSIRLNATGGITYAWTPTESIDDSTLVNPRAFPDFPTKYYVYVTDKNACTAVDSVEVDVVPEYIISPKQANDTIFIGEFVEMQFDVIDSIDLGSYDVDIQWNNDYALDCDDCKYNYSRLLKTNSYTITTIDPDGCYPKSFSFTIVVEEKYVMDVPSGFTPNSDLNNDLIYVRGIGVKELIDFTIYNRWGEVVFKTSDINEGWDGTYKGKMQNDETYVYQASVLYWNETVGTKRGYITLLK